MECIGQKAWSSIYFGMVRQDVHEQTIVVKYIWEIIKKKNS